jgi:hypothetical protein
VDIADGAMAVIFSMRPHQSLNVAGDGVNVHIALFTFFRRPISSANDPSFQRFSVSAFQISAFAIEISAFLFRSQA